MTQINSTNLYDPYLIRKDLNFKNDVMILKIGDPEIFLKTIKKDSEFLEDLNLMDYSMLVYKLKMSHNILSELDNSNEMKYYKKNLFINDECDENNKRTVFCFTIIDYLQDYNFSKNLEYIYKNFVHLKTRCTDGHVDISCVPADRYSKRFVNYFHGMIYNLDDEETMSLKIL